MKIKLNINWKKKIKSIIINNLIINSLINRDEIRLLTKKNVIIALIAVIIFRLIKLINKFYLILNIKLRHIIKLFQII